MSVARPRARISALVCAAMLAATLLAGCGGGARSAGAPAQRAEIQERDFHIAAPARLHAGKVRFVVHNEGPDQHELIMVAGGRALPLRHDGLTVDEESVEGLEPGSLEPGEPGSVRTLTVDLKPGRYQFFCNMEGHYMGGMHAEVVVS